MSSPRVERVKRQLLRELTAIIKENLKDPRVGFVTVIDVELSPDLRHAKIFVSIMGNKKEQEETFQALTHASGFVRTQVGQRMRSRHTPEIVFIKDESMEYVSKIYRIMDEIKTKESHHGAG